MKALLPLTALAIGAFAIGTTEFAPMGLLTVIAMDLKITIPMAGLIVSAYAIGVLVGVPLLTLTTSKLSRKSLLLLLMAIFTIGNLLSAIAVSYGNLILARIFTSLCHGPFFGVGAIVAASLVPENRRASAVAAMFMGLTIANIGGVPLATWIGQTVGWRTSFYGIAAFGALTLVILQLGLPKMPKALPIDIRKEVSALRRPAVLIALATTVLGAGAMFTVYTYITPILQFDTQVTGPQITGILSIYGLALTIGNYIGGKFADRALDKTLVIVLGAITALLVLFSFMMRVPIAATTTIFLWGIATFALVPALQTRIMQVAADAPNLASSLNIGAFNLGNAMGAVLGGAVLSTGFGFSVIPLVGAVVSLAALGLVLTSARSHRRIQLPD
jgi:DHA1 family inner membrane transport protein